MRLALPACPLALVLALVLSACSGEERVASGVEPKGEWTLADARAFDDFPLYAPGESFEELPLTAVLRRFDSSPDVLPVRTNFVGFLYGSCDPGPDSGCGLPLDVQVWAACERNPGVYSALDDREGPVTVRGVPAYFYEGGRRLELSTGTSTVVIFAESRDEAMHAAAALVGINNDLSATEDLPPPAYERQTGGVIQTLPCPYDGPAGDTARAIQASRTSAAAEGHVKEPESVECVESTAPEAAVDLDHFYDCTIVSVDGSTEAQCVLVRGEDHFGAFLDTCDAAAAQGWPGAASLPTSGPAGPIDAKTARWAIFAERTCLEWHGPQAEAVASLDQEMVVRDLSYIWSVLRPYQAALLEDLRKIRAPSKEALHLLALYDKRLALIDRGLETYQSGRKKRGVELFSRATARDVEIGSRFTEINAPGCAPAFS